MPGIPWWGESVTFTIVPPCRPERQLEGRLGHVEHARRRSAATPPASPSPRSARPGVKYWPPALFTSTSSRPWRSSTRLDEPLGLRRLAHVARHPSAAPPFDRPRSRRSPRGLLQHLRAPPRDRHSGAAARQLERRGLPEARAPAGHERHPAAQQPGREDLRLRMSRRSWRAIIGSAVDARRRPVAAVRPRSAVRVSPVSHRPLAFVPGSPLGDYLLWNWSLNGNHDVLALVSGLTLPPLARRLRVAARPERRSPDRALDPPLALSRARRRPRRRRIATRGQPP